MWDQLPSDILTLIFSFLPPDSLAGAALACRHWHLSATAAAAPRLHPPWFLAMHTTRSYALNPSTRRWSALPPHSPLKPIAAVADSLLLCRLLPAASLRLAVTNPFTGSLRCLPPLNRPRSSPAVGLVVGKPGGSTFRVFVAGGTSGGAYEPTLEVYESAEGRWRTAGEVPPEFAVRLTVWTPNESVHDGDGGLYWVTSARAYSMVAFELKTGRWREIRVPEAHRLECAALVVRPRWATGRVALVGGVPEGPARVWELGPNDSWTVVAVVSEDLGRRFIGAHKSWSSAKCTSSEDGVIYLYRENGSGMLVWAEKPVRSNKWTWNWVEANKFGIRGVLLHPSLARLANLC